MSRRVLLRAGVLAGSLFLLAGLTPQTSTLMSAEPAAGQAAAEKAALIQTESAGAPTCAAELKILKALAEPTELRFIEEPLTGVMDYFSKKHGIQIVMDIRALEDVSMGTDEPMTRTVSGISLRSALDLILRDLDLTWTIYSEVLLITTLDVAELRQLVKVYDVGDLVTCQDEDGRPWHDYGSLSDTITYSVAPDTWEETTGGPGSIEGCTFASAKVLVVRQSLEVQLEVAQLLDTIRRVAKAHGTDAEPPMRKRPPPTRRRPVYGMGGGGMEYLDCGGDPSDGMGADPTTGKAADAAEKPPE